ncbi:hypothetical protein BGW38_007490 [Lunasporangiospora selenospora]|uniref:Thioredoxin-like protein n=1 Tax=Lunasporangiospora selenospora TaxID=979761 RepID=A0A9P6FKL1_9FUNG|nr:hypothetical protein BGW38_007490 [Lunasporangiospora selenospora]
MSDPNAPVPATEASIEPSPEIQESNKGKDRYIKDETLDVHEDVEKDLDDDELFEELENDDFGMASLREQRMEEYKEEISKKKLMMENEHGIYKDVTDEKQILDTTTKTKHCVVHFYHSDFRRCMIVDKHLEALAKKHYKTKFMKIKVENAPFLVEKLQVKMLPCVISFTDGIAVDRLIGFEELGNTDSFSTAMLELRYKTVGVIEDEKKKENHKGKLRSIYSSRNRDSEEESEGDDDY